MRITGGKQPLDATSVHPESYEAAKELLKKLGCQEEDIAGGNLKGLSKKIKDKAALADELGIGVMKMCIRDRLYDSRKEEHHTYHYNEKEAAETGILKEEGHKLIDELFS